MAAQLAAGQSCVVESNFEPQPHAGRFTSLREQHDFQVVQIQCVAAGDVIWQRFKRRAQSGMRHPGHVDDQLLDELKPGLLRGRLDPLDIGGELIEVDMSDFVHFDYEGLYRQIEHAIPADHRPDERA